MLIQVDVLCCIDINTTRCIDINTTRQISLTFPQLLIKSKCLAARQRIARTVNLIALFVNYLLDSDRLYRYTLYMKNKPNLLNNTIYRRHSVTITLDGMNSHLTNAEVTGNVRQAIVNRSDLRHEGNVRVRVKTTTVELSDIEVI